MSKSIILCGFMGSGKTTVGRLLAKKLLSRFIDLDEAIEQQQKMSVATIFEQKGEDYFRGLEHVTLQNALDSASPISTVIAVGGGTFCDADNIRMVREDGATVVYLSTDFDICYERIKASNRPLVMRNTREELRALYEERNKIYDQICTTQLFNHAKPGSVVDNIISLVNPLSIQKL